MRSVIEGLLYLTGEEGLSCRQILKVMPDWSEAEIEAVIKQMKRDYAANDACGLEIVDMPGGWRMTTKSSLAAYIEKFASIPIAATLSQAALETVAIVAYRQPISRIDIEELRGVKSERALHTLMAKGLIEEVGRAEGAGRAILYGVTPVFLDYFGFRSLEDLPPLSDADAPPEEQLDAFDLFYDDYKETKKD